MLRLSPTLLPCLLAVFWDGIRTAAAVPTWPSSMDELEDIQLLNTGYRARAFSAAVTPCTFSAQGPGRQASAEWLRTAFHDMAPGSVFTGVGGLDGSLNYEIGGGENIGSAFQTTLTTYAPFFSSRSSLADIIAMGVYTAVRSCGGLPVPVRTGRIDATEAGPVGVPLPQNSLFTFQNQFARFGFNATEMIAVTACGHTIGGVHAGKQPCFYPISYLQGQFTCIRTISVAMLSRLFHSLIVMMQSTFRKRSPSEPNRTTMAFSNQQLALLTKRLLRSLFPERPQIPSRSGRL